MKLKVAALACVWSAIVLAAGRDRNIITPESNVLKREDRGRRFRTHYLMYNGPSILRTDPAPLMADSSAEHGPSIFREFSGPSGYHPTDIRSAYLDTGTGQGAIAIVDAFHYPTALKDFNVFAARFDLPAEKSGNVMESRNKTFQLVYANGMQPGGNRGWNGEEALDIEWAHAMAPKAKIYLVEAGSNDDFDLFTAVKVAQNLPGVTQISMSWGAPEYYETSANELGLDPTFSNPKVTYFASSGDDFVQEYPAMSPHVVQVGGTSLYLAPDGEYSSERGWYYSGGGPAYFEHRPAYQAQVAGLYSGWWRGGPDISAVADPYTGVAVYDSGYYGWVVFGGTSVASPVCAGIANAAGQNRGHSELEWLYAHPNKFHDVTSGYSYYWNCTPSWDFVTGLGSPKTMDSL